MCLQPRQAKSLIAQLCKTFLSASLFAPTVLLAANPIGFDGWNVTNGVIDASASCGGTTTCTTMVEDDGFLQQQVVTPEGTFFRTIITESGATGQASSLGFATETLIPQDNLTSFDMSTKQAIREPANGFSSIAIIDRDPYFNAQGVLVDPLIVDLKQTLATDEINANFRLLQHEAVAGLDTYYGKSMDIDQSLSGPTAKSANGFKTQFDMRKRSGVQVSRVNNELQTDPFTPAGSMTLDNQQIGWNAGDSVKSVWVATRNDELDITGSAIQSIENLSQGTSAKIVALDVNTVLDPFDWDSATFDAAPPSLP